MVAVSEKAVLRVPDLLDWIADPKEVDWTRGSLGIHHLDCNNDDKKKNKEEEKVQFDRGLNAKFSPGHSDFLNDVRAEKISIGDVPSIDDPAVIVLSSAQYARYRAILKRLDGVETKWMHNSIVVALGGFTVQTK